MVNVPLPIQTLPCSLGGYFVQGRTFSAFDLSSGVYTALGTIDAGGNNVNAIGFNALDGFVYGVSRGANPNAVYRIGTGGQSEVLLTLPAGQDYYMGDIDESGQYWIGGGPPSTGGGSIYTVVDLNPTSATYGYVQRRIK